MVLFLAVIAGYCFGIYWLAGKYLAFFNVDIKMTKYRVIRAVVAVLLAALSVVVRIGILAVLHLFVLWGLLELFRLILRPLLKKYREAKAYKSLGKVYRSGLVPIILIAAFFMYGYFNMSNVQQTRYTIESNELSQNYRVVFISDTHYDTIQNTDILKDKIEEINSLKPDLVILGGDIVEEGTSKPKMQEVFERLGNIDSTYGTYYIYGNHDRQRYTGTPQYTEKELADTINRNGITILKEQCVSIGDDILLVGREDLSARNARLDSETLVQNADTDRFILVADHQANDVDSNISYGADLQLSGHTHGGQIFPLGWMSFLYHGYVYGEYTQENCDVIVSSGFAGWGFPIRTQGVSEYVVVDLKTE